MEILNNRHPQMEFEPLKAAIEDKATLLLTEITEENIKVFAQEVKMIAESVMEQYVFKVYDIYSDGALKITDLDKLASFTDFSSGYQSKMLAWNNSHPIQLREQKVEIPRCPEAPRNNQYQPAVTVTIGTVVAIGIFVFSNAWVALAAEILALSIAYRQKAKQKKSKGLYEAELSAYNSQLGMKRMTLINGLTDDLIKWLEMGKEYSDSILVSYNI